MLCSSALSLYWGLQRWECHTCHVTHVYYSLHFCQVLWQTHSGNALLIQSFSVMKCVHENRPRSALFFGFFLYVWVRVRVCSSVPPSLFVQYELSISASRRVWEEQIDPQTSRPRARNRRSLCRRGAVCISGSQSEAKQKQHPAFRLHFNTSFKTENMEHSPENVEKSLLLKMQRCVIQDPHQQRCRWEENPSAEDELGWVGQLCSE